MHDILDVKRNENTQKRHVVTARQQVRAMLLQHEPAAVVPVN